MEEFFTLGIEKARTGIEQCSADALAAKILRHSKTAGFKLDKLHVGHFRTGTGRNCIGITANTTGIYSYRVEPSPAACGHDYSVAGHSGKNTINNCHNAIHSLSVGYYIQHKGIPINFAAHALNLFKEELLLLSAGNSTLMHKSGHTAAQGA